MPKVSVYNQEGKQVGDIVLSDKIFGIKARPAFVHEVVVAQQANARHAVASTKTKGEVRGGGKKPWKQKGTGRARQGSIRSPQWVGGGIVFGPSAERNFSVKINKKAKHKALFMALSDKVANQQLLVLEGINMENPKTKTITTLLAKLPMAKTTLLVGTGAQPLLMRMVRNLPSVRLVGAHSLNMIDVLSYRQVVFLKDAVPVFEKIYA